MLDCPRHRTVRFDFRPTPTGIVNINDDFETRVTDLKGLMSAIPGEDCLVIIHTAVARELGRRYVLDKPQLSIGRGVDNDIVIQSDDVSRYHVKLERHGSDLVLQDLKSTNGTFANKDQERITVRSLMPGDQIRVGDTVFKFLAGSDIEAQYHAALSRMAITDGLTDLCNRKRLDTVLAEEILRAKRYARELSVLMLDVDHFKRINDTHGHLTGDAVLCQLASLLRQRLRTNDEVGRYGGEEFCAILPETDLQAATQIAESLRIAIDRNIFATEQQTLAVTASIGVATLDTGMQLEDLYRAADLKLYEAKRAGRNRVCH